MPSLVGPGGCSLFGLPGSFRGEQSPFRVVPFSVLKTLTIPLKPLKLLQKVHSNPTLSARKLSPFGLRWDERLPQLPNRGGKLRFDPAIHSGIEHVERESSTGQDLVMKRLEVELGT